MRGQQPDLSLASLDWLDSDEKAVRAQAEQLIREHDGRSGSYRGSESSGSIRVTVDRGARLVEVQITDRWFDRLSADRFAAALFEAYTTAAQTAMVVEAANPDRPGPRTEPPIETIPPGLSDREWENRVAAQLAATEADLAMVRRAEVAPPPVAEEELRGRNGYLTLVLRGGGPAAITADPKAIAHADAGRLRQDVLDVFAQAGLGVMPPEDEDTDGDFGFEY